MDAHPARRRMPQVPAAGAEERNSSGSASGGARLGLGAPEHERAPGRFAFEAALCAAALRVLARDRLERHRVEPLVLEAVGDLAAGEVAMAGGPGAAVRAHRAAGLAREPLERIGIEHAARLEDRALLRRERRGDARAVPGVARVLAAREVLDLAADA